VIAQRLLEILHRKKIFKKTLKCVLNLKITIEKKRLLQLWLADTRGGLDSIYFVSHKLRRSTFGIIISDARALYLYDHKRLLNHCGQSLTNNRKYTGTDDCVTE